MADEAPPKRLCFVVGPVGADDSAERVHADWLLEMIIQPVIAQFPEFETRRADQLTAPGMIDAQVINALLNADLVVADMSTRNPNAFYEIGIRHMAQKPIIHMQLAEEVIPFDVGLYRAIKYSRLRPRDLRAAQDALRAQVAVAISDDYRVDNPVTRTRGVVALEKDATPSEKLLLNQLRQLQGRVRLLEGDRNALLHRPMFSGGDALPEGTTLLTFISKSGFHKTKADTLFKLITRQLPTAVRISLSADEMNIAVPGEVNIKDIELPPSIADDLDIIPLRPYDPGS